jgi:hypothetical protein
LPYGHSGHLSQAVMYSQLVLTGLPPRPLPRPRAAMHMPHTAPLFHWGVFTATVRAVLAMKGWLLAPDFSKAQLPLGLSP